MSVIQRGSLGWRRRYEGQRRTVPSAVGAPPPCEHDPIACSVAELWPIGNETRDEFKARLRRKYNWSAIAQEAVSGG